jgi:hypothetical protein
MHMAPHSKTPTQKCAHQNQFSELTHTHTHTSSHTWAHLARSGTLEPHKWPEDRVSFYNTYLHQSGFQTRAAGYWKYRHVTTTTYTLWKHMRRYPLHFCDRPSGQYIRMCEDIIRAYVCTHAYGVFTHATAYTLQKTACVDIHSSF